MTITKLEKKYIANFRAGRINNPVPGFDVSFGWHVPDPLSQAGHHTGEDHACPEGTPVVAVTWGHVVGAGWGGAPHDWGSPYGNVVLIEQENGQHTYGYCHLSAFRVHVGDAVKPGQVLGLSGNTGNSTGPHCHFEVRPLNGTYGSDVDPMQVKVVKH